MLKGEIGRQVAARVSDFGLVADISSDYRDAFLGDSWFDFLLRCKYMLGVEGGSSLAARHEVEGVLRQLLQRRGARCVEEPIDWADPGRSKIVPLLDPLRMLAGLLSMRRRLGPPPAR